MDIKTISATLALLGSSILLPACDDAKKDAAEVKKDEKKADVKAPEADAKTPAAPTDAKAPAAADAKGEMSCGEGKCGADKKAADAKGEMACGEGKCGGAPDEGKSAAAKAGEGDVKADAPKPEEAKKDAT